MTGVVMVVLGLFKLGSLLNYVSQSVTIGFISAVGAKLVLASAQPSLRQQLDITGVTERIGEENLFGPRRCAGVGGSERTRPTGPSGRRR